MKTRYLSLDVFRGMTIAGMILVNTPGSWDYIYAPLAHAEWHGFTVTDLVFPSFMFIMGVTMRLSFAYTNYTLDKPLAIKILKRCLYLFLIAYFIYLFPFTTWKEHFRILGVLPRLGLAFAICAFIVLTVQEKYLIWINLALLLGYWLILSLFGDLDPTTNAALAFDKLILGENHLYRGMGFPFDPEGLLSTLPSLSTVLLGYSLGVAIQKSQNKIQLISQMGVWAGILVFLGIVWDISFPINKKLWTSSFVLFCAGLDLFILAVLIYIIDVKNKVDWSFFFKVFGMNSIAAYALSGILAKTLGKITVGNNSLYGTIYEKVFRPILGDYGGSLAFAIAFTLLCWLVVYGMYRKKWFWRV